MTLEPSQPTFFDGMELPSMSSPAGSRARTFPSQESSAAWAKAPAADCGPKSSDWLASYDRNSSSWRTSQLCLVALVTGEADGLAEFSETWPSAGMMRNGKTYRRQPWALPIAESASGLLPPPRKVEIKNSISHLQERAQPHRKGPGSLTSYIQWLEAGRPMFPTPTASMHRGSSPAALTRKDGQDRSRDRLDHFLQSLEGSGKLNPAWVEWLMGFPMAHTDLQPSEMQSCQPSQS
jgi:hypothetical protein